MIIFLGNEDGYEDVIKSSKNDRDIDVSCQYRHIVPESLINSHVCVNIHYGELPFFAGCNPVYWQMMKGYTAGVTLHYMDKGFDSGDIIDQFVFPFGDTTADEVYDTLKSYGSKLFHKHFKGIVDGSAPRREQNTSFRKYYNKNDIDFSRESHMDCINDRKIKALHFKGKQLPKISIGNRWYEISSSNSCI